MTLLVFPKNKSKHCYIHILAQSSKNKNPVPSNTDPIAAITNSFKNDLCFSDLDEHCSAKKYATNINPKLINPMNKFRKLSGATGGSNGMVLDIISQGKS